MGGMLPALSRYHKEYIFIDDGLRNFHRESQFDRTLVKLEREMEKRISGSSLYFLLHRAL